MFLNRINDDCHEEQPYIDMTQENTNLTSSKPLTAFDQNLLTKFLVSIYILHLLKNSADTLLLSDYVSILLTGPVM